MSALVNDLPLDRLDGDPYPPFQVLPAVNGATYFHGGMIADVSGVATKVTGAPGLKIIGWCNDRKFTADTSKTGLNEVRAVTSGMHGYRISATDPVTSADNRRIAYAEDDNTIARTSAGGALSPVFLLSVLDGKAYVIFGPIADAMLLSGGDWISMPLSLGDLREVTGAGDVGAVAAIGGVLASDTTPLLQGNGVETWEIVWAAGEVDTVGRHLTLPANFDGNADVTIDLWVKSSGTTNAASFTIETGWDGAALIVDTATDAVASTTVHKIAATIAKADVPNAARNLTMYLTPAAHATDAIHLMGYAINHKRS